MSYGGGGGERGNYSSQYGYHNRRDHRDRINEEEVPESKHTIFIRGLPGNMSTDEVKDYFEDKVGPVSFDFVKTSPDNQRLFVAVRFETREDAKTAMNKYIDRDLLGHRCELSWFKDIRRFAQYQATQLGGGGRGMRGRGGFRGRGSYRGGYHQGGYDNRDRDRDRSRSRSRSRSRKGSSSRSRSRSRHSDSSRSRSPPPRRRSDSEYSDAGDKRVTRRSSSRESRKSNSPPKRKDKTRSRSRGDSDMDISFEKEKRSRKKEKKSKKKKSRRSNSGSRTSDDGELHSDDDISKLRNGVGREPTASPISMKDDSPSPSRPVPLIVAPSTTMMPMKFNIKMKEVEDSPAQVALKNTSFSIGMENDDPPRVIRKLTPDSRSSTKSDMYDGYDKRSSIGGALPPPPPPPSFNKEISPRPSPATRGTFRPIGEAPLPPREATPEPPAKKERVDSPPAPPLPLVASQQSNGVAAASAKKAAVRREEEPLAPPPPAPPILEQKPAPPPPSSPAPAASVMQTPSTPLAAAAKFPVTTRFFADLRDFQSKLILSVKAEPKQEEEFGGLRLSSLSMPDDADDQTLKQMERESKLASLDEMATQRFMVHKKRLEAAFRNDCETFAIVTKKLLAKDESLEQALRMALIENMEDLEKQMMEKVDAYLVQQLG